jgi:hypothetical protein
MAVSVKKMVPGSQLTAGAVTYYTCPSLTRAKVTHATLTNHHASNAVSATIYLVPSGGSASDDTKVIDQLPVGPLETLVLSELAGHVIESGGTIQALASSASIMAFHVSGVEVT